MSPRPRQFTWLLIVLLGIAASGCAMFNSDGAGSSPLDPDDVANGIVTALGRVQIDVPIVIRLDGTNADLGREILASHLSDTLQMQPTMVDAARTAVELAGK